MKKVLTEILIQAPVEDVWEVLSQAQGYSEWNPFIQFISDFSPEGERITVRIHPEGQKRMTFAPVVLVHERNKEFHWEGVLFVKGLFDGEHFFRLIPEGPHQTRFVHGEHFSGILVGPLMKMIGKSTLQGFHAMNEALKARTEKRHQASVYSLQN